jgi:hypothetical protein
MVATPKGGLGHPPVGDGAIGSPGLGQAGATKRFSAVYLALMADAFPPSPARRVFLLALGGLAILSGAATWWKFRSPARLDSQNALNLLAGMETANLTFFRLNPIGPKAADAPPPPKLRDWEILQTKSIQDRTQVDRVRAILMDASTYGDQAFNCFDPGLGFRFETAGRRIELVICLSCRHVYVYEVDRRQFWILSDAGARRLMEVYEAHTEPAKPAKG